MNVLNIFRVLQSPVDLAQTQCGTPVYMSPEVFSGTPYTTKVLNAAKWSLFNRRFNATFNVSSTFDLLLHIHADSKSN